MSTHSSHDRLPGSSRWSSDFCWLGLLSGPAQRRTSADNPALPAGMDIFTPPVAQETPAASAP